MNYRNLEEFLENYKISQENHAVICDIKPSEIIIKNLIDKNLKKESIFHYDDIFSKITEDIKDTKKIISYIETEIIVEKIIGKNPKLKFLENLPSSISGFIETINNIRLFPIYQNEITGNIKEKALLILELYQAECKKNNFIDQIDRLTEFLDKDKKQNNQMNLFDEKSLGTIILYGDFFNLNQLQWQLLKKYCSDYETIFISPVADIISDYFKSGNFIDLQDKLKKFFHSGEENSLYYYLKNFNSEDLKFSVFSDWEDEINHIAYQIRDDINQNKLNFSDIGIYLPADIYKFKIDKIFDDFSIPYYTTFETPLSEIPLSKFISFFLEMDWNNLKDVFKFLNSPFVNIDFSDFKINEIAETIFLEKNLKDIEINIESFDNKLFEEILNQSGIDNFFYQENTFRKLKNYFEKEAGFSMDNFEKVCQRYKVALIYLAYFQNKIAEFKSIMAKTIYPNEFINSFNNALKFFHIKDNYFINETATVEYQCFIDFWQDLINKLSQVNPRKHSLSDYSKFYKNFSRNTFFNKNSEKNGVLVTDSSMITKSGLKRIYLIGMTNRLFPAPPNNDIFSAQIQKINPISLRDIQLFTFVELLKNYSDKNLDLRLSFPKITGKEDNEASELLVDIKIKYDEIKLFNNPNIYSHTDKCKTVTYSQEEQFKKIKEIFYNRKINKEWTKYEGHLENITDERTFEKQTSISQIEEFSSCPMKFFFNRKLRLSAKKEKKQDIEANIKGDIIHKILESYYSKLINEYSINLDFNTKLSVALEISNQIFKNFEEIYDNLYLDHLKYKMNTGLQNEERKGILFKVLTNDEERILEGWIPSKFEHDFKFQVEDYKFTGSIDRIDINADRFQIIDYKTGGMKTIEDIKEGLAFQLPVYAMAFHNDSGLEFDSAGYYALKDIEKIKTSLIIPEVSGRGKNKTIVTDNKTILDQTIEHLVKIKPLMKSSKYNFTIHSPEKVCGYCDFNTACHYDPNKISGLQFNDFGIKDKIHPLDGNIFSYSVGFLGAKSGLTDEQKSALAIDKNIIVVAGAGAGKTEVLTQRMLDLLEKVEGKIEKILVITFTKKATAEMQYRIYSSVSKKIVDGEDNNGHYLQAKLNFTKNWISTIDGFYMRTLKENSLDMELDQEFKIAETQELKQLIIETIEKKIDDLSHERDQNLEKLLHVWTRKQIIEHCETLLNKYWIYDFLNLENYDDLFITYQNILINDANQAIQEIDNLLQNPEYSEANGFPEKSVFALLNCKNELIRFLETFPDEYNPPNMDDDFKLATKPRKFTGDYDLAKKVIALFPQIIKNYEMAKTEKECLISLFEILKVVEKVYQEKRKKDNINNFSDISMELYNLLRNNKNDIRKKLQEKFSYIMIDEFQDTDLMQWEIAKYLSGWDGKDYTTIQHDKLFIVGDDKQSIYGFRGGDVQVFNSAREEILQINNHNQIDGGFIQFPDNFRSSANIIDFFNKFFYVLFGNSEKKYDARHQNLKGHKQNGTINFFVFNKGKSDERINENTEPQFIAHQIKEIFKYNPEENIAILFRTKSKMDVFASELEKLDINYIISGGRGFYETSEVNDLHNILAFLSDERRKIELTGFLRSPMAGLSDTEIYNIREDMIKGIANYPEINNLINGVYQDGILIKKGWKQSICDLNIHELVIQIIKETNYKAYIFHESEYLQKIKNLEKFIEICKEKEDMTLHEFVEFLDYQKKNNTDEANATILELGKKQPVQLMTIHASKGLGFDTVIIADSGSAGKQIGSGETIFFGEIEDFEGNHIGFKVPEKDSFEKTDTSIKNKIIDLRRKKEEAELKRLLYVALTRVKHNLIISATVEDELTRTSNTFIEFFSRYFTDLSDYVIRGENKHVLLNDIYFHIYNHDCEL